MRAWISTALVTVLVLAVAPAAQADTSGSSNWAGYAVHRTGASFEKVSGSWRQPAVTCTPGQRTYSAFWVGIGGFNRNSPALEQIGTEADCTASGQPLQSAWYELVPAPSTPISFPVRAGDLINAAVTVKGHRVTMTLYDATRHHGFTKTLNAATVDTTSAEWIVEAPSECNSTSSCQTLPLANFGAATFTSTKAESTRGHLGAISNPAWGMTKINLVPGGRRFIAYQTSASSTGSAAPSALRNGGSSFKVTYSLTPAGASPFMTVRSASQAPTGRLFHPAR